MRKAYTRPFIEFETYSLSDSIAANCGTAVSAGPEDYQGNVCSEFRDSFGEFRSDFAVFSAATPFYDGVIGDVCDCYTTSGGQGYFTS